MPGSENSTDSPRANKKKRIKINLKNLTIWRLNIRSKNIRSNLLKNSDFLSRISTTTWYA